MAALHFVQLIETCIGLLLNLVCVCACVVLSLCNMALLHVLSFE